ncbi:hypothetical protein Tco_1370846 [Tanacetum coccineum]
MVRCRHSHQCRADGRGMQSRGEKGPGGGELRVKRRASVREWSEFEVRSGGGWWRERYDGDRAGIAALEGEGWWLVYVVTDGTRYGGNRSRYHRSIAVGIARLLSLLGSVLGRADRRRISRGSATPKLLPDLTYEYVELEVCMVSSGMPVGRITPNKRPERQQEEICKKIFTTSQIERPYKSGIACGPNTQLLCWNLLKLRLLTHYSVRLRLQSLECGQAFQKPAGNHPGT